MSSATLNDEPPIRVRIPADLDTPDRVVGGLTARQLAVLTAVAVPAYGLWQVLQGRVPVPVLAAAMIPVAAVAVAVSLGRRDGLSLDRWLVAAIGHRVRPRHLIPVSAPTAASPAWAPADTASTPRLGLLRLPAEAIGEDGVISTGPGAATVLVAASTVTTGLHTPTEQAGLLGGYARWLNSLTGPVQVVVSARRVDLGARALHLAETAHQLPHPALARAAIEHAEHLLDLAEDEEQLTRTITIACTATARAHTPRPVAHSGAGTHALRRAQQTAAALSGIGSRCRVLSGAEVTAVLIAATDPFAPTDASWPRRPPAATITAADPGDGPGPATETGWDQETWSNQDSGWDDDPQNLRGPWGHSGDGRSW
jgi:hypothetical protein